MPATQKGMITHYGLNWSEKDVYWGRPKSRGQLLGQEGKRLKRPGAPTDAELEDAEDYRDFVGVYCLYGDGELIYIGEAGLDTQRCLFDRLKEHRKGAMAGRWDSFSWFGRKTAAGTSQTKNALAQVEAISIAIINPGFNKQAGTFAGASQVFQVPHRDADGDLETKLVRLTRLVEQMREELA